MYVHSASFANEQHRRLRYWRAAVKEFQSRCGLWRDARVIRWLGRLFQGSSSYFGTMVVHCVRCVGGMHSASERCVRASTGLWNMFLDPCKG